MPHLEACAPAQANAAIKAACTSRAPEALRRPIQPRVEVLRCMARLIVLVVFSANDRTHVRRRGELAVPWGCRPLRWREPPE